MKTAYNGYTIALADTANTVTVIRAGRRQNISIPPVSRIRVTGEICPANDPFETFQYAKSKKWRIAPLSSRTDPTRVYTVPGAVDIAGMRVSLVDDQGNKTALDPGKDYTVEPQFAWIAPGQAPDSVNNRYSLDYTMRMQRVDVIAEKDGEIRLFTGSEALVCPPWPLLDPRWTGLARIYQRFTDKLDESAVYPIYRPAYGRTINFQVRSDRSARMPGQADVNEPSETDNPLWPQVIDYSRYLSGSAQAFARLRDRFARANKFSMVYFGDSITQGGDVPPDLRFTRRFSRYLKEYAPQKHLTFHNAAVGGTNSIYGRERFDRDVLAHNPDAVTILFALNDRTMDDRTFLENHNYFIDRLNEINAVPILLTSNMNTGSRMAGLDRAEERIRALSRTRELVCLDAYGIWKALPEYGIPYETLLSNGINHPDGIAVGVFFELLKMAFSDKTVE